MGLPEIEAVCKELKLILAEIATAKASFKCELIGKEAQDAAYRKSWTWLPEAGRPPRDGGMRILTGASMTAGTVFGSRDIVLGGLHSAIQKLKVVDEKRIADRLELVANEINRDAETERAVITRESTVAVLLDVLEQIQAKTDLAQSPPLEACPVTPEIEVPRGGGVGTIDRRLASSAPRLRDEERTESKPIPASHRVLLRHLQRARYELMGADLITGAPVDGNGVRIPHDPVMVQRGFVLRYRTGDPAVGACITQLNGTSVPCWLACINDAAGEAETLRENAVASILRSHLQAFCDLPTKPDGRKERSEFCTDEIVRELDRIIPLMEHKLRITSGIEPPKIAPTSLPVPDSKAKSRRRFKVALSFPGEIRSFVKPVAECLLKNLGNGVVFYDEFFSSELARMDLDGYLQNIYHQEADFICAFISTHYDTKEWCGLEWRAIRDLIKRHRTDAIIIIRVDDTDPHQVQGIFSTDGYIDARFLPSEDVSMRILQRMSAP